MTNNASPFKLKIVKGSKEKGKDMNDFFVIMCTPYDGYGERYIWCVYRNYDNAISEFNELVEKYNMKKDTLFTDTAYNYDKPSLKNRFYKFEIENRFFED